MRVEWKPITAPPPAYKNVVIQTADGQEMMSYMYPDKSWSFNHKPVYWKTLEEYGKIKT
jgi:hypothetical protein